MLQSLRLRRFSGTNGSPERAVVIEVGGYRGATWLLFFLFRGGVVERRRLTTFPPNWHELPPESLAALFSDAAPVRPAVRTPVGGGPPAEGEGVSATPDTADELESARSALEIAHLQLDALAMALADREAELEQTREELQTLNAEIQAIYQRAVETSAPTASPPPVPRDSAAPNE